MHVINFQNLQGDKNRQSFKQIFGGSNEAAALIVIYLSYLTLEARPASQAEAEANYEGCT